jgi:tetratricopeptide (TPR) repeat protein
MYGLKSSWHLGKGSKYDRKGFNDSALKHYLLALKYHGKSSDKERPSVILESIAWSYAKLHDYQRSKKYAEESLAIYSKYKKDNNSNDIFTQSIKRVEKLLKEINNIQS